ncbi:hypothetical protein M422DRAFT_774069 [Sphaerobolus stellatus SS14]|nr:hypothetical protein M422DRAFT_774069 [Sphaerobolus stellatus SS14]
MNATSVTMVDEVNYVESASRFVPCCRTLPAAVSVSTTAGDHIPAFEYALEKRNIYPYNDFSTQNADKIDIFLEQWRSPPGALTERHIIYPIISSDITERKDPISEEKYVAQYIRIRDEFNHAGLTLNDNIPPLTTVYQCTALPYGWQQFINPQGHLYFWNETCRTLTSIDLRYSELLKRVSETINLIYHGLHKTYKATVCDIPVDLQLVLDIRLEAGAITFGYYFASFERRCLFWLGQHNLSRRFSQQIQTSGSRTHLRHNSGSLFARLHYKNFPDVQECPKSLIGELQGLVLYAGVEKMHNSMTIIDFSDKEIQDCTKYLSLLVPERDVNPNIGYTAWSVGNLMNTFAIHKFSNCYGQKDVRWKRGQEPSEGEVSQRSVLLKLLSPFLFYTPDRYFFSISTAIVGSEVFSEPWLDFVRELHMEWQNLTLIALVILIANLLFLNVQSVNAPSDHRSVAQILSYISTIAAIGSILLIQLITKIHQIKGWEKTDLRVHYNLLLLTSPGASMLSITYSLPYAVLLWGIFSFMAAFSILCLANTDRATQIVVGVVLAVLAVILLGCIIWAEGSDSEKDKRKGFRMMIVSRFTGLLRRRVSRRAESPLKSSV